MWCDVCENQPLEYFDRVAELGYRSVGGWFGGGFVGFENGDDFCGLPDVGYGIVTDREIKDVGEGPDGDRPKMLQVPVGDAIRAGAGGGFGELYCGLGHVGGDWRWRVSVGTLSALYSVE